MIGGIVYAEISCNAAVSDFVPANSAFSENRILDLLRTALYDRVGIRTCQRDSVGAVGARDDLGVGAAGDRDAGDRVFSKSVWDSDACGEAGGAGRSDGGVYKGDGILKKRTAADFLGLLLFAIEILIKI